MAAFFSRSGPGVLQACRRGAQLSSHVQQGSCSCRGIRYQKTMSLTVSRAFSRSRRGTRPPPPRVAAISSPDAIRAGSEDDDNDGDEDGGNVDDDDDDEEGILFQDEDSEEMLAFMEEYDEVTRGEGTSSSPTSAVVELETVEEPDGTFSFRPRSSRRLQRPKETAREFLKSKRKEVEAMTQDEWFEFLRRIGEPSPEDSSEAGREGPAVVAAAEKKPRKKTGGRYKFVDKMRVVAHGGQGGKGCISFEIMKPGTKRPSGGHGGQGGDVVFVADPRVQTLDMDRHHFHGRDGGNGDSKNKRGARGSAVLVRVPCGTVIKEVRSFRGGQSYETVEVCDLDEPMSFYTAAVGGKPGLGNQIQAGRSKSGSGYHFRSPGHEGEQRFYELELKTIADVGLVGYPNVGKSTLLGSLSRARPKVADYAFTTLHPTVGKVEYSDAATVTVADLPGLIDGAHMNRGLGHEFLRHIERTKVLLFVLDGAITSTTSSSSASSPPAPSIKDAGDFSQPPLVALENLRMELELYCPGLSSRPSIVFINKSDLMMEKQLEGPLGEVKSGVRALVGSRTPIIVGSAKEGRDLEQLAMQLRLVVEETTSGDNREDDLDRSLAL